MRRNLLYLFVLLIVLIAAVAAYRVARQPIRVGRSVDASNRPLMREVPKAPNLIGQRVPAFAASDLNGSPVSAEAFRGRVLVLNVWATWCRPCRDELPRVEQEV